MKSFVNLVLLFVKSLHHKDWLWCMIELGWGWKHLFLSTYRVTYESSIFQSFPMDALRSVIVQICSQTSMTIKFMFMVPLSHFHSSQWAACYRGLSCKIRFANSAMWGSWWFLRLLYDNKVQSMLYWINIMGHTKPPRCINSLSLMSWNLLQWRWDEYLCNDP